MTARRQLPIALVALLLIASVPAPAAESKDAGPAPAWEETLPGDLTGPSAASRIGTTRVLTAADLERLQVATAAEALERLSDVHVTVGSAADASVRVRGYDAGDALVLLDGVPLGSALDARARLDLIPVAAIEKIVVRVGAPSVLDGPGGQAGAIEIVTRRPRGALDLTARGRVSTGGEPDFELTAAGRAKPVGYVLSAAFQQTEGFHLARSFPEKRNEDGGRRNNSDRRLARLLGKIDVTPIDPTTFFAVFDYQDAAFGVPPSVRSDPDFLRVPALRRWTFSIGNSTAVGRAVRLGVRFFWSGDETVLAAYDDATYLTQYGEAAFTRRTHEDTWGLQQTGVADLGKWSRVTWSLWFQRDAHRDRLARSDPWTKYVADRLAAGIEDEIRPVADLSILAGVGVDALAPRFSSGKDAGTTALAVVAHGGATYRPATYTEVRASVARTAGFPTLAERYGEGGDPDLAMPTALVVEAGVSQGVWEYAKAGVTGFYSLSEGGIVAGDTRLTNDGRAVTLGATLDLAVHPWRWVDWTTGYTFLSATDETKGADGRLAYRPAHKLATRLAFTFDTGTEADAAFRFVGAQDFIDPRDGDWSALGAYYVLDLRVAQRLLRHFLLYASAENVLDFDYETETGFPRPGRTIWLGARFDGDVLSFR
jgi:iron complex outermembrane receptor protein